MAGSNKNNTYFLKLKDTFLLASLQKTIFNNQDLNCTQKYVYRK